MQNNITTQKTTTMPIVYIAKIGLLSAIAAIVMIFQVPLWFAPSFYKLDLSDTVVLIGGFALNPIATVYIQTIKIFLNFLIDGTATAGIGELANFLMGISFAFPASYIYHKNKSIKSAVIGLLVGTVSICISGCLLNLYLLIPAYSKGYGLDALIGMGTAVNPKITDLNQLILFATLPFNLVKAIVNSIVTLILYKRLSKALKIKDDVDSDDTIDTIDTIDSTDI